MDYKAVDLVEFNRRSERRFEFAARRYLDLRGGSAPLADLVADMAALLDVSPVTVKRYIQKHGGRLGFLDVRGGVVSIREERDTALLEALRAAVRLADETADQVAALTDWDAEAAADEAGGGQAVAAAWGEAVDEAARSADGAAAGRRRAAVEASIRAEAREHAYRERKARRRVKVRRRR